MHTYSASFTDEQVKLLVKLRLDGLAWEQIEKALNEQFSLNKSSESMRHVFRKCGKQVAKDNKMKGAPKEKKEPKHPHGDFTKAAIGQIVKKNDLKEGLFFVTTASPTSSLDYNNDEMRLAASGEPFVAKNLYMAGFKAVKNFMKQEGAELIILPGRAHVRAMNKQPQHFDPLLKPYLKNFATEFVFNKNLKAVEVNLNPQQINPLTGLSRIGRGKNSILFKTDKDDDGKLDNGGKSNTSIIVGHTKQMMEPIATGNNTHPRLIQSTGSITLPSYLPDVRVGSIALEDHCLGGLIVSIKGDKFFIWQVQFDLRDGSFVYFDKRYYPSGKVKKERAKAFKMGDLHPGYHCQTALNTWYQIWEATQPENIYLEDWYDGGSTSHHVDGKFLTEYNKPECFNSIEAEMAVAKGVFDEIKARAPKDSRIVATNSNHPEHLLRYLDEGRYITRKDRVNYYVAHKMVTMLCEGKNLFQEYLDPEGRIVFLGPNDDDYVEGVQMGSHGHLGVNGARGGKNGFEVTYCNAVTAHLHSPFQYHNLMGVGHTTTGEQGYLKGPSTWIQCSALIYEGGQKSLVFCIDGQYR